MQIEKRASTLRIFWSILFFAALFLAFLAPPHARAQDNPLRTKTIVVGIELDFAPYISVDTWGRPEGYSVDLIEAVAKHADLNLHYVKASWSQIRQKIQDGSIDAVPMMAKTSERAEKVDFSDTHVIAYDGIFIRDDNDSIHDQNDLRGKRIIVMSSDLADDYIRHHDLGANILRTTTALEAFKLLAIGQADAFITSQIVGLQIIDLHGLKTLRLAERSHFGDYQRDFGFAVKKGDIDTLHRLNEGLKAVVASGEYGRIYEKWFSNLDPDSRRRAEQQRYLSYALLAAIIFASIAAVFSFFLQREVYRKTKSLRKSRQHFRGLVENLPGVVFRLAGRSEWHFEFLSDSVEGLTGYPAASFLEKTEKFLSIVHPEDAKETLARANEMLELEGRFDLNFRVVHKLGDIRWVNLRGSSTLDEKEQVTYFDGIMLDVTEQKRVNDLLTSQQSKMASSARLSALGEMAGGIAHEINNPLAIINLRTHQLTQLTAKDKLNPNDVVNIAEAIEATTMRISKIIKALQIVARESESDPFETTPVIEIVSDAVELCNQRMKKHGIQLIVDPIPPKLMIECRCVQVSQVLINLLNNAFDAIVELPSKWVRISAREVDNSGRQSVEISVADSGNAIRVDLALKIFQPFFTTKGPGKGTGLGLSISKGMIESQDGNIFLDTDHATTRFVIVLPKEQQAGDQAKHQKQLQGPQTPPQEHFL